MKKIKLYENLILSVLVILYFVTLKGIIPKYIVIYILIGFCFYFFPAKFYLMRGAYKGIDLASDLIISLGLALLIVGFYWHLISVFSVFGLLNFAFMVYLALHNDRLERGKYYHLITNHFLLLFLLSMLVF